MISETTTKAMEGTSVTVQGSRLFPVRRSRLHTNMANWTYGHITGHTEGLNH
jgi:hypothetical protein